MATSPSIPGSRLGAICSIAGSIMLLVGTYLHPMPDDPNDAVASFTVYAADRLWVASHLTQLGGIALIVAALLILAHQLEAGNAIAWSRIAAGGAIASLAVATALQAVDGVALKTMVNAWAEAPVSQKEAAFRAAFAVRQIEVGLASTLSAILGVTATIDGVALLVDGTWPKWLGALAIGGGAPTAVAGVVMAYTGFSGLAMAINMPANLVLVAWMFVIGIRMWARSRQVRVRRGVSMG
jgi:uncharacterized membrane protein (DUF2068 family)